VSVKLPAYYALYQILLLLYIMWYLITVITAVRNHPKTYFTSHAQLYFLPGKHHLIKNLIVNSILNFSLYGSDKGNTRIHCNTSAHIVFKNCQNINIKYITIKNCKYAYSEYLTKSLVTLFLTTC